MSLSGNLADFDLSYIFQIIAQEGKTGRLVLNSPQGEGFVVFKNGMVVAAGYGQKNLRSMLIQYLYQVRKYSESEIREIELQFKNNLSGLANAFLQRQFFRPEEVTYLIQTGLEDIVCSLFTWKAGTYALTVMPNVDPFQVASIAIPCDAVTMEAARREDELKRLKQVVPAYKVFIHGDLSTGTNAIDWTVRPEETIKKYLYVLIDGTSSVDYICKNSFLTEYRVFQELAELKDNDRITPLPDKLSKSINAALERKRETQWSNTGTIIFSSVATALCMIFIIGFAIFLQGRINSSDHASLRAYESVPARIAADQTVTSALLLFHATNGVLPMDSTDLFRAHLIEPRDVSPLRHRFLTGNTP